MNYITLKPIMSVNSIFFLILLYILHTWAKSITKTCPISSCGSNEAPIRFPFWLNNSDPKTPEYCRYPGFALTCNNQNQTILTLPNSGDFLVGYIDYTDQTVIILDPNNCFLKRYLAGINTSHTPFRPLFQRKLYFLNCTESPIVISSTCLTSRDHTIWATDSLDVVYELLPYNCSMTKELLAPVEEEISLFHSALAWDEPDCRQCEMKFRAWCYKKGPDQEIGCGQYHQRDSTKGTKSGFIIGFGVLGLITIGLISMFYWNITNVRQVGSATAASIEISPVSGTQQSTILMGLDELTIESYPMTQLDTGRCLPNPNNNTCAICLNEYQPNETLRTIPKCNHYFHVECIDEWLRINITCPICRNFPTSSSLGTSISSLPSPIS